MIEIDEETVDKAIDDIMGDDPVRDGETQSAGGAQVPKAAAGAEPSRRVYELICKDCGVKFGSAGPAARYCPACRKKRTSPPANDRQVKTGNKTEPEGAGDVENGKDQAQKAWDELDEATAGSSKPAPEPPDPADMETEEVVTRLADGMRKEPGDVALALYKAARDARGPRGSRRGS